MAIGIAAMGMSTIALGIVQGIKGAKMLKDLEGLSSDGFSVTPEVQGVYDRTLARADQGIMPAERSLFNRNRTRALNNTMFRGRQAGGGQSSSAMLNMGADAQMSAEAMLASKDAEIRLGALGQLGQAAQPIQGVVNQNENREMALYDRAVEGAASLQNTGIENMINGNNSRIYQSMLSQQLAGDQPPKTKTGAAETGAGQMPQVPTPPNIPPVFAPMPNNQSSPYGGQYVSQPFGPPPVQNYADPSNPFFDGGGYLGSSWKSRPLKY